MKLGDAIQTQTDLTVGAQILQRLTAELRAPWDHRRGDRASVTDLHVAGTDER
jgi:hypothetical protein